MNVGDTFINNNPSSYPHLWVLTAGPTVADEFLIFNLTSHTSGCDETCLVQPGEHPFVRHLSVVRYQRGRLLPRQLLEDPASLCAWNTPIGATLLQRIQAGALASRFTKRRYQEIVRAHS